MKLEIFLILGISLIAINPVFAQNEDKIIVFTTPYGHLAFELFPEDAPNHVNKVLSLTEKGFYDGMAFHRVIKGFMIQIGDSGTKENQDVDPGKTVKAEFNTIKHQKGIVAGARTNDPDSFQAQIFFVHKNSNFLNGKYTAFGRLVTQESFDTLNHIANLETNKSDKPVDLKQAEIWKTEILNRRDISNLLDLDEPARTKPKVAETESTSEVAEIESKQEAAKTESKQEDPKTESKPKVAENTSPDNVEETVKSGPTSDNGQNSSSDKKDDGGCLIATAAFGSELSPQVQQLREIRDNALLQTSSGTSFMAGFNSIYYSFSPTIADMERENPVFKEAVKLMITPLITSLSILNYVDIDSEVEVLGYGISLILLNIGMYVAAPVGIGLIVIRKI